MATYRETALRNIYTHEVHLRHDLRKVDLEKCGLHIMSDGNRLLTDGMVAVVVPDTPDVVPVAVGDDMERVYSKTIISRFTDYAYYEVTALDQSINRAKLRKQIREWKKRPENAGHDCIMRLSSGDCSGLFNADFVLNVIDVIGKDSDMYLSRSHQFAIAPPALYIVNPDWEKQMGCLKPISPLGFVLGTRGKENFSLT